MYMDSDRLDIKPERINMNRTEKINKLNKLIFIYQNINASVFSSIQEKEAAVKLFLEKYSDYTFYEVCRAIQLNKGTYYNFIHNKVERKQNLIIDDKLKIEIKKIYEETQGRIGTLKIKIELEKRGFKTSKQKVSKLLKDLGLKIVFAKHKRKAPESNKNVFYHNLLRRQFFQNKPNKVWISDFTEIKVEGARFYLCVIMDLFSRKIVGWRVSLKCDANLAVLTFKDAYTSRGEPKLELFHSDQGSQYTSFEFRSTLRALNIKQSFSNPGTPHDNAVMESFYSIIKREEIYRKQYKDYDDIKNSINEYIVFYNDRRSHKTLGYISPTQYEDSYNPSKRR